MPSSPSPSLRLEEQFTGENINLWGLLLNRVIEMLDDAIAGMATIPLTGGHTLTSANYVEDEARNAILKFTGALAVATTIIVPSVSKVYIAWNATNRPLVFTTGGGATVSVDPTDIVVLFCDGSGVRTIGFNNLALKDYITAVTASAGAVPSPIGNAGKYLYSDGANVFWRQPSTTDLSDYADAILGVQVALAVAL